MHCFHRRVVFNGPIIKTKATAIQSLYNSRHSSHLHTSLKFSDGWFYSFKSRWNLRKFSSHRESDNCDDTEVQQLLPSIRSKISQFSMKYTFNGDEFILYFRMAPDLIIAGKRILVRNKAKERLSILVCANENGSERFSLIFIGTSWKPRVFKKKSSSELGMDNHANKKNGWHICCSMTGFVDLTHT